MATTQNTTPITLTLTEQAAVEVRKFMAEEQVSPETAGLRIGVLPGGCSGFRYSLNIEDKPAEDDLDYKSTFQESGFAFENPNATGGCGCGSSFTV